jgi:hypothetical protein
VIRIVHAIALTILIASGCLMIASILAHNSAGLESSADGLATTYLLTFALAVALSALVASPGGGCGLDRPSDLALQLTNEELLDTVEPMAKVFHRSARLANLRVTINM